LDEFVHKIIKRLSIQGRKKSPDNTWMSMSWLAAHLRWEYQGGYWH
jgi:hypothetical protein